MARFDDPIHQGACLGLFAMFFSPSLSLSLFCFMVLLRSIVSLFFYSKMLLLLFCFMMQACETGIL